MTEPCNRLLKARTMAGYRSGRAAAAAMGVRPATYASHENGSRAFGVPEAHKYAELFDVSPGWILTGEALHQDAYTDSRRPIKPDQGAQLPEGLVDVHKFGEKVLELVAQLAPQMNVASEQTSRVLGEVIIARMVDVNHDPDTEQWRIISQWNFPKTFIEDELGIPPEDDPAIIAVVDDNMAPTYRIGDRLIMNFSKKQFAGDGVYIFMDEDKALHLQRLEDCKNSKFRISNDNQTPSTKHPERLVDRDAIEIVGLVKSTITTR